MAEERVQRRLAAILAPERLRQAPPDAIIVMNTVYRAEIEETVRDLLPDDRARAVTWLDA